MTAVRSSFLTFIHSFIFTRQNATTVQQQQLHRSLEFSLERPFVTLCVWLTKASLPLPAAVQKGRASPQSSPHRQLQLGVWKRKKPLSPTITISHLSIMLRLCSISVAAAAAAPVSGPFIYISRSFNSSTPQHNHCTTIHCTAHSFGRLLLPSLSPPVSTFQYLALSLS